MTVRIRQTDSQNAPAALFSRKYLGYPGVTLETRQDNVPACSLYARCGFRLGGFDSCVYTALQPQSTQTALYWYLIFG